MQEIQRLGLPLQFETIRSIVEDLLSNPPPLARWTVQGLGMLRLYWGDHARLHIWDDRLENPEVSKIHNHSWRLRSLIVAGTIYNTRYKVDRLMSAAEGRRRESHGSGAAYMRQSLHCGINSTGLKGEPELVYLTPRPPSEKYTAGESYMQESAEVHLSDFDRGTVTIMERRHDGNEGVADVFWPYGSRWREAIPRPATSEEVKQVTEFSLKRYFR